MTRQERQERRDDHSRDPILLWAQKPTLLLYWSRVSSCVLARVSGAMSPRDMFEFVALRNLVGGVSGASIVASKVRFDIVAMWKADNRLRSDDRRPVAYIRRDNQFAHQSGGERGRSEQDRTTRHGCSAAGCNTLLPRSPCYISPQEMDSKLSHWTS